MKNWKLVLGALALSCMAHVAFAAESYTVTEIRAAVAAGCEMEAKAYIRAYGTDAERGGESEEYGDLIECMQDAGGAK